MIDFKVDQSKCTNCKKCVTDCPVLIIDGKTDFPEIKPEKEATCIKCQHCLAICPEGAISILGKKPEDSIPTFTPDPSAVDLGKLIKTRRSVRRFKKVEVEKDLIAQIVENASYAPTAKNENSVLFTVVDNKADMLKLEKLTYDEIIKATTDETMPMQTQYLGGFAQLWANKGIDIIYRNAPHMLVCSAPDTNTQPEVDATIAASYFELLANSHGISTLWDGFAKAAIIGCGTKIRKALGIPDNHHVAAVLVFGRPAVRYARSTQNPSSTINTVKL